MYIAKKERKKERKRKTFGRKYDEDTLVFERNKTTSYPQLSHKPTTAFVVMISESHNFIAINKIWRRN